ncbi:hypothetical protein CDAR_589151 [Caerostris darwini]|uniref:Uncharacterized protein n=1 Tax=Caerostris darwini TaxID=1538125 RepID=A0AAV4T8W1_9ARAC|nr:hypothetical protein CDAR_589151 [Caerostris darwini]
MNPPAIRTGHKGLVLLRLVGGGNKGLVALRSFSQQAVNKRNRQDEVRNFLERCLPTCNPLAANGFRRPSAQWWRQETLVLFLQAK